MNGARTAAARAELSDSLDAVNDMLQAVDTLLAGGRVQEVQRSARALVGMASDTLVQARELLQALEH